MNEKNNKKQKELFYKIVESKPYIFIGMIITVIGFILDILELCGIAKAVIITIIATILTILGVIILLIAFFLIKINYNDAKTTKKLLENVKSYSCLSYIVVVDNCSTDRSYEELSSYQNEKIKILRREDGREFGAGINFGLRYLEKLGVTHTFVR